MTDTFTNSSARYWVGSDGDSPLRIMFDGDVAKRSGYIYVDAFDAEGTLLQSSKWSPEESGYINNF